MQILKSKILKIPYIYIYLFNFLGRMTYILRSYQQNKVALSGSLGQIPNIQFASGRNCG